MQTSYIHPFFFVCSRGYTAAGLHILGVNNIVTTHLCLTSKIFVRCNPFSFRVVTFCTWVTLSLWLCLSLGMVGAREDKWTRNLNESWKPKYISKLSGHTQYYFQYFFGWNVNINVSYMKTQTEFQRIVCQSLSSKTDSSLHKDTGVSQCLPSVHLPLAALNFTSLASASRTSLISNSRWLSFNGEGGVVVVSGLGGGHWRSTTKAWSWPHHGLTQALLARIIRVITADLLSAPSNYPAGPVSTA